MADDLKQSEGNSENQLDEKPTRKRFKRVMWCLLVRPEVDFLNDEIEKVPANNIKGFFDKNHVFI